MKKGFLLGALAALAFVSDSSCSLFQSLFGETSLTVENNSSYDINIVKWNGIRFGDQDIYDSVSRILDLRHRFRSEQRQEQIG